ncbi:MAG: HAD-IIB family hydrolase [Clostridia bacterium]|nr:HAD-IIB family hydrolase [Clostridia bacterium]
MTLYISDLDGTLLDKNAELPPGAGDMLNCLAERGVAVTYATARTIKSVGHILRHAPKNYPAALMNGVLVCDLEKEKYLSAAYFNDGDFRLVRDILREFEVSPFYYYLDGDELSTAYEKISNKYMESFMAERVKKYNKPFIDLAEGRSPEGRAIYFAAMDSEEKIKRANEALKTVCGIRTACYRDSYEPDFWYLEVFDKSASKKNATLEIKRLTGAYKIVAFGDNYNDLPMFEAADECYAVSTAPSEVIAAADGTVGPPDSFGVILKIMELEGAGI